jgi:hypothetical protein
MDVSFEGNRSVSALRVGRHREDGKSRGGNFEAVERRRVRHSTTTASQLLLVVPHLLHRVADQAAYDRASQRVTVIDHGTCNRADGRTARLAVVMAMAIVVMARRGEGASCGQHHRKAEDGCCQSGCLFGRHFGSTSTLENCDLRAVLSRI